ncbi:MAG: hypothetical protein JOZ69_02290, partial [Myxococcales bacterium]|nr:hypothetical protein [Myxococcales bacterium]
MTDDRRNEKKGPQPREAHKKPADLANEMDWDQALSEWENESFVPEAAKDVVTDKPGTLAGASRPLYRPPPVAPGGPPPAKPERARVPAGRAFPVEESETGVTRMARVPDELLREQLSKGASARGGLGQLFAREEPRTEKGHAPHLAPDAGRTAPPPPLDADSPMAVSTVPPAGELGEAEGDTRGPVSLMLEASEEEPTRFFAGGEAAMAASGPALLAPESRRFDPNDVTGVGHMDPARSQSPSATAVQPPDAAGWPRAKSARPWEDERPASEWLSADARDAMSARVVWLEAEARALEDSAARARGLLACSEMLATLGDLEPAQALAAEARDLSPSLVLAHRQARALLPSVHDGYPSALKAEIDADAGEAARVHALLLWAEILNAEGEADGAAERLEEARRSDPGDARAAVLLAARALARGDLDGPALRGLATPGAPRPGLPALAEAVAVCRRLRGLDPAPDDPPVDRSPSDVLLDGRRALDRGDVAAAARIAAELADIPGLERGAKWLAASLGATVASSRPEAYRWLREIAEGGDEEARRAVAARAIELGDTDRLADALRAGGTFTSAERAALAALSGRPLAAGAAQLDATAATAGMTALAAGATAIALPGKDDPDGDRAARIERIAGAGPTRALVALGRLLAAGAPASDVERSVAAFPSAQRSAGLRGIALEMAWRAGRASDVSAILEEWGKGWGSGTEAAVGPLAAAIVAERAGDTARALAAFKACRTADPTNEAALRAIASLEAVDLVAELNQLADDLGGGVRAAMARIEAVSRSEGSLPEPTRAHMLEQAHDAAPSLPIAAFLAERIARRAGDVDEVLRWARERRARATDPVEAALDGVREALLVADREPSLAAERLHEA